MCVPLCQCRYLYGCSHYYTLHWELFCYNDPVHRQSIKEPKLWNSEPASARSTLTMVVLCSRDFKLYSDTSSVMPCQLVIEIHALEWVCVWYSLAIFCKLKNEGSLEARRLRQILFQIGKNFYGDFSEVVKGLWIGLFEPYAMSRVVPAFQIGQNVHQRQTNLDGLPSQWMTITLRKCLLWFVNIVT